MGEFLDLETGILEFCICVLLGVKLNGRLGEDFNPGFNNHFKHSEKKNPCPNFNLTRKYILKGYIELNNYYSQSSDWFDFIYYTIVLQMGDRLSFIFLLHLDEPFKKLSSPLF